jgi:hypothetical protein
MTAHGPRCPAQQARCPCAVLETILLSLRRDLAAHIDKAPDRSPIPELNNMRTLRITDAEESGIVTILNHLFNLEYKARKLSGGDSILRNVERIKEQFEAWGYTIEDPSGQKYDETRTDCQASIAGESTEDLVITDVIKPLIRFRDEAGRTIKQRAVVVVRDKNSY